MGSTKLDSHYMPFYVERWLASTTNLSAAEKGIYIDLLALQWENRGPVTEDQVAWAIRPRDPEATEKVLAAKFRKGKHGYSNARLEERRSYHEKKRRAGSKGGSKTGSKPTSKTEIKLPGETTSPEPEPEPETKSKSNNQAQGRNSPQAAESSPPDRQDDRPPITWEAHTDQALGYAIEAMRQLPPPQSANDRRLVAAACIAAASVLSEHWLAESLGAVTRCATRRPYAKLTTALRERAAKLHTVDFDAVAAAIEIPAWFYDELEAALADADR